MIEMILFRTDAWTWTLASQINVRLILLEEIQTCLLTCIMCCYLL